MWEVCAGNVPNIGIRATACMRKVVNFTECRHDTKRPSTHREWNKCGQYAQRVKRITTYVQEADADNAANVGRAIARMREWSRRGQYAQRVKGITTHVQEVDASNEANVERSRPRVCGNGDTLIRWQIMLGNRAHAERIKSESFIFVTQGQMRAREKRPTSPSINMMLEETNREHVETEQVRATWLTLEASNCACGTDKIRILCFCHAGANVRTRRAANFTEYQHDAGRN